MGQAILAHLLEISQQNSIDFVSRFVGTAWSRGGNAILSPVTRGPLQHYFCPLTRETLSLAMSYLSYALVWRDTHDNLTFSSLLTRL